MPSVVRNSPNNTSTSANNFARTPDMAFEAGRAVRSSTLLPILITQVGTWVSGNGGTRAITLTLGSSSVTLPSVAASASAQDTGLVNLTSPLLITNTNTGRANFTISVSPTGAGNEFFFGRLTSATGATSASSPGTSPVQGVDTTWVGKLPIRYTYVVAPLAPTIAVTSPFTAGSTSGRATVSWTAPDNGGTAITGYNLQYSTSPLLTSNVTEISDIGSGTTSYNVDGLTPGVTYYFRVFAKNAVTEAANTTGPGSSIASTVVSGLPTAPRNLTATPSSTVLGRVDLAWTAPSNSGSGGTPTGITGYRIYADSVQIGSVGGTTLAFSATGLTQRQTYSFTVRALNTFATNNGTTGPDSNAVLAKSPGVPTPPRNLTGFSEGTSAVLSWDVPTDVGTTGGSITGYDVYKSSFTPITATGGTLTTVTRNGVTWNVHSFTNTASVQNFTVSSAGSDGEIRYLVVGGGGSGGRSATGAAGGGGAGGFIEGTTFLSNGSYAVTVGAGGATKTTTGIGNSGLASSIASIASAAGGGGGGTDTLAGASGASGGGGGAGTASRAGGAGTSGIGNNGGSGFGSATASQISAGGGGGAGAAGANGAVNTGGSGGNGLSSDIRTGSAVFYAGGGGGGHNNGTTAVRPGGTGGGGAGGRSNIAGTPGSAETGGGGGGAGANQNGGAGGSGIVVISYPTTAPVVSRQSGSLRTFTHTNRLIGSTYSYVVKARNAIADTNNTASADSNAISVLISVSGPENFTVSAATDVAGRLVLSWDEPATATGYKIFQVVDGNDVLIQDLGLVTTFKIDELTPGTTYTYKIKARSIAQPEGGYFSGPLSASPNAGSVQAVPSVSVANDTNERFSGTFAIISVTATTLEYANENPSYPENTVPTTFGTIDNLTNQNLEGTYTIATPTSDTITFSKVGSDIPTETSVSQGTLTNETNVPLVGDFVALAGTSGSSILYSVTSPDVTAEDAVGTVTSLTSPEFNETGAEITAVTEITLSYDVIGASDSPPSAAAGTITNQTNTQIFNGENIEVETIVGYDTISYTPAGDGALLDSDHSSTVEYPLDAVEKVDSEARVTVKYRSGWLA